MSLKERVLRCEKLCGTHIALNHPVITEILGYTGFDFIWIDTEHTSIGYEDLLQHLNSVRLSGTPGIVRVSMADRNHVKRVLEMGPDGIIFPMINTVEEAEAAMRSCMYPPRGTRGFGPLGAVQYGRREIGDYIQNIDNELCRFIQIESCTAVRNLPEIVKNPYIDGYIFGPCDLSGSIGELNNVFGKRNVNLMREAVALLKEAHKCIGVSTGSTDPEVLEFWDDLGVNMISSGTDYDYMRRGALKNRATLRRIQNRKEVAHPEALSDCRAGRIHFHSENIQPEKEEVAHA